MSLLLLFGGPEVHEGSAQFSVTLTPSGGLNEVFTGSTEFALALAMSGAGRRVPFCDTHPVPCPRCGFEGRDAWVTRCPRCGRGMADAGRGRFMV